MQIVINIPDEDYKKICANKEDAIIAHDTCRRIANWGTPLPKGHGDLVDRGKLLDELDIVVRSVDDTNKCLLFWDRAVAFVHLAPIIIPADKESE